MARVNVHVALGCSCLVLLAQLGLPFKSKPARLELVEETRAYAPDQNIPVRLSNRSEEPIYLITEIKSGVRTEQGRRLPGQPVYERRRQKFFFRSERWAYSGVERARFRPAVLEPGDAVVFPVTFSAPAKYKVHLRFWRRKDIQDPEAFLQMNVMEIEERFERKAKWLSTPSFRIRAPQPAAPKP